MKHDRDKTILFASINGKFFHVYYYLDVPCQSDQGFRDELCVFKGNALSVKIELRALNLHIKFSNPDSTK